MTWRAFGSNRAKNGLLEISVQWTMRFSEDSGSVLIQIEDAEARYEPGEILAIRTENIEEHQMHRERYEIPKETADQIHSTKSDGGRVVAVGTTVVRALESAATDGVMDEQKLNGDTSLFITPGFEFQIVDCMVTNFHLPRSSLLLMVAAFVGQKRVLQAYKEAVKEGYRFFSYGDASWLEKNSCSN